MTRQGGVGTTSVTARRTPFEVRFFSSNLQYIALASFAKHMREKDENQTQNSLSKRLLMVFTKQSLFLHLLMPFTATTVTTIFYYTEMAKLKRVIIKQELTNMTF